MLLSRRIDDKEIQLKNQSLIFFQISGAGHEAVLTAAGMHLRAGYDWFYPYYRDRALCLTLGMTPLEMLLAAVGAKDDPNSGGRQMPSHWGHKALNIPSQGSPTGTQCLQAVGAGEAGMIYERVTDIADRERAVPRRRDHLPVDRRRRHQRRRVLGVAEHRVHAHRAGAVLVEDNGYAISVPVEVQTPGGDVSRWSRIFPQPQGGALRRHRLPRQLPHARRGGRLRAPRAQAGVRARQGDSPVLALALGRRAALQDAGGAQGRSAARSADQDARVPARRRPRHRGRPRRRLPASVDREIADATDAALEGAEAVRRHRRLVRVLADVDPDVDGVRDAGAARGQARHDGRGDQSHAEETRWRATRASSSSARTSPTRARRIGAGRRCPARAACSR